MSSARNLVNMKAVEKSYASRPVLRDITLGISAGQRIGVVGRNGDGKSTLLRLIAGTELPDAGTVTRSREARVALLDQHDQLAPEKTVREILVDARADPEWARESAFRDVLDGLLGGVELRLLSGGLDTEVALLSGGERRRIALARLLLDPPELLLLDEPTNHLDVEGVDWLARHLTTRRGATLVVTHDRWFLDAACTATWEVADCAVHEYDGGYAAYVLARAERDRQAAAREDRRQQLLRKELAWLRRGPPARTTKPKFRIEAANALIADEPRPRDSTELLRFATSRLGDKVINAIDVSLALGSRRLLRDLTWRIGPGDRVAIVGVNGSGKSSLLRLLAGETEPTSGRIEHGATVRVAHLSQGTVELPRDVRVRAALEEVRHHAVLSDGREITAGMLCERFGFRGAKAHTPVDDLSGGERRRLSLMRLLMEEPNVLLLDEPTNDLDIDTLTALEDLLDDWPGTLIVVSHDRYFVERVCEDVYSLTPAGGIDHLPGGIDQYIQARHAPEPARVARAKPPDGLPTGARIREARKRAQRLQRELRRTEREIEQLAEREGQVNEQMAASASDHARLLELHAELERAAAERDELEASWLELSEALEAVEES